MSPISPVPPLDLTKATILLLSEQNIGKKAAPACTLAKSSLALCNVCRTSRLHLCMDTSTNPYGSKTVHVNCRERMRLLEEYLKRKVALFTRGNPTQTNEALVLVMQRLYELILEQTSEKTLEGFANKSKQHEEFKPLANLALEAFLGRYKVVAKEKEESSSELQS